MIKHLPNIITLARCGLAFLVGYCIITGAASSVMIFGGFVFAAVSDFIDGALARALKAESAFGAWLDPIADKILVAVTGVSLCIAMDMWAYLGLPLLVIIIRDTWISWLRRDPETAKKLPVIAIAKWKTALEMFGLGTILAAYTPYIPTGFDGQAVIAGVVMVGLAAILSAYTALIYWRSYKSFD